MSLPAISIAMATFNGAAYLQEQLDSLAAQTLPPCELVICDDGSTDATSEIAERFAAEAPFPVHIHRNERNLGFADNFLKAASLCRGSWIAFSDQDDVWDGEKLHEVSRLIVSEPDAVMVVHDAEMVDENLFSMGKKIPGIANFRISQPLGNWVWWTPPGFVCCFKSGLVAASDYSKRPGNFHHRENSMPHDYYVYFLANMLGKIIYTPQLLAKYRRHTAAVSGNYDQDIGGMLKTLSLVGSEDYFYKAGLLSDYAEFARSLGRPEAASHFGRLSKLFRLRGELYAYSGSMAKLVRVFSLAIMGGYKRRHRGGLGVKSLLKDVAAAASGASK